MRFFLFLALFIAYIPLASASDLLVKLQQIKEISGIEKIEEEPYGEYYTFWFEQPVNHDNPSQGTFRQKVALGHKKEGAPVIVELQGYDLKYTREEELSKLLGGNQIKIEHRFFAGSVPAKGIEWEYLTIKQAATDHHKIIEALQKHIYPESKWISTGISKGGQVTIFHRYFYPGDVDVSVPYVAPLNLDLEDGRIEKFLDKLGMSKKGVGGFFMGKGENMDLCGYGVRDFQLFCFENIKDLYPLFEAEAKQKDYSFEKVGGLRRALELVILEYRFSFWQWGTECKDIPKEETSLEDCFRHLIRVSTPTFFEDKEMKRMYPFMHSAFTEIGMYHYSIKHFKKYLPDKKPITFSFALPEGVKIKPFNKEQMATINHWLQTEADKMLFIYGGQDPWSATAVDLKANNKCYKYIKGDMHHGCRIASFEAITREDILDTLKEWLKEK